MGLLNRLLKPLGIQSGGVIKAEHISQIWDAITGENLVHSLNFPFINPNNFEIVILRDMTSALLRPNLNLTGGGASDIKYVDLPEPIKFGILVFGRNNVHGSIFPSPLRTIFTPLGSYNYLSDIAPSIVIVTEEVDKTFRLGGVISPSSDYGLNLPSEALYLPIYTNLQMTSYARNNGLLGIYTLTKRNNILLFSNLGTLTIGDIVLRNAWLDSSQRRLYFDFVLLENTSSTIAGFNCSLIYVKTIP